MKKEFNSDYLRGHIDTIILKTLFDGEKYGYEICKDIEEKSNGAFILKQPSLYSALKRLETNGLISSRWQDSEIGGKRHYYSLTDEGRLHYQSSKDEWDYSANILNSLISNKAHTQAKEIEENSSFNIENEASELNVNDNLLQQPSQMDFFNSAELKEELSSDDEIINITTIEPEKEQPIAQEEKREKNDAAFINETYIDENNDVSFSNNVFLRVKNSLKPSFESEKTSNEPLITQQTRQNVVKEKHSRDYKIKPYSKFANANKNKEFFKVNKFNLFVSLFMFLIASAEIVSLFLILSKTNMTVDYSKKTFISIWILTLLPCALYFAKILINPYKKGILRTKNKYLSKSIISLVIISIIISINVLITPTCFNNKFALTTILLPCIITLNILIHEVIYNLFKKFSIFNA